MSKKIKVIVVDDSAFIRQIFSSVISEDPDIEVIATAVDPYDAREKIKALNPDVITLDIEMPKMDGITFLEKIMSLRPMPVVMVSTLTQKGADATIRALELGAIDYVSKPTEVQNKENIAALKQDLIAKIKVASKAKVRAISSKKDSSEDIKQIELPAGKILKRKLIAIGASTGGVEALREVLIHMPANSPPVVIVQHMPPKFTKSFAERLDGICAMRVHEAVDGQEILSGNIYIAPGDMHLRVERHGTRILCRVKQGEHVSGHCPSVDVLFGSVADCMGDATIGVILTGMGRDGAAGMLAMKKAGSINIGQNQDTCVVYGMPKEAFENGSIDIQMPLVGIAKEIIRRCFE